MPDYSPPIRGQAYRIYVTLEDQANAGLDKVNPTIAAADFTRSLDGGGFGALTTTPTVVPAGGAAVQIDLSAAEMTADNVLVRCSDSAGAEWFDRDIIIQPTTDVWAPSTTALSDAVWTNAKAAFLDAAITSRSTLIQADILSDATPFPGADIDATISSRSTLAQADILSDATPFAGANVDVASSTLATDVQAVAILAAIAALNDLSDVEVWTYVTRTLTDYPGLIGLLTHAVCSHVCSTTWVSTAQVNLFIEAGTTRIVTGSILAEDNSPIDLTGAQLAWRTSTGLEKTSVGGDITILAPPTGGAYTFTISAAETTALVPQGGTAAAVTHQMKVKLAGGDIYSVFEGKIRIDNTLVPAW